MVDPEAKRDVNYYIDIVEHTVGEGAIGVKSGSAGYTGSRGEGSRKSRKKTGKDDVAQEKSKQKKKKRRGK